MSAMPVDVAEEAEDDDAEVAVDAPEDDWAEPDGRPRRYPCHGCGAECAWQPGAQALTCPYCGHREELPQTVAAISEYPFNDYLRDDGKRRGLDLDGRTCRCPGCAAVIDLTTTEAIRDCPFCGSMVEDHAAHDDRIRPEGVVPFALDRDAARAAFRTWLKGLWFAPGALAREARADRFQGVYRTWWTFDSHTLSHWSGQAGTYYWVTRTRTVNGKTRTYRVRKTRWRRRSGRVERFFDDVLTPGFTTGLAADGYRLAAVRPFDTGVLAGFVCERYELDPTAAWPTARTTIEADLREVCRRRLGGDTQRFLRVDTAHRGITFKSVLLPVWNSTYRYNGTVYRIAINGQTGAVRAERPYSWLKIGAVVLLAIAVVAGIAVLVARS